jgi:hypothetical protein
MCQDTESCLLVNFTRLHDIKSQKVVLFNTVIVGSDCILARTTKHSSAVQRPSQAASRESTGFGQDIHVVWITRIY